MQEHTSEAMLTITTIPVIKLLQALITQLVAVSVGQLISRTGAKTSARARAINSPVYFYDTTNHFSLMASTAAQIQASRVSRRGCPNLKEHIS